MKNIRQLLLGSNISGSIRKNAPIGVPTDVSYHNPSILFEYEGLDSGLKYWGYLYKDGFYLHSSKSKVYSLIKTFPDGRYCNAFYYSETNKEEVKEILSELIPYLLLNLDKVGDWSEIRNEDGEFEPLEKLNINIEDIKNLENIKSIEERQIIRLFNESEGRYQYFDFNDQEVFELISIENSRDPYPKTPEDIAPWMKFVNSLVDLVKDYNFEYHISGEDNSKIIKFLKERAKKLSIENKDNIYLAFEKETNPNANPKTSRNGGGYHQPYIEFYYNGNLLSIYDSSCGDFGDRYSISMYDEKGNKIKYFYKSTLDGEEYGSTFDGIKDRHLINQIQARFGYTIISEEITQQDSNTISLICIGSSLNDNIGEKIAFGIPFHVEYSEASILFGFKLDKNGVRCYGCVSKDMFSILAEKGRFQGYIEYNQYIGWDKELYYLQEDKEEITQILNYVNNYVKKHIDLIGEKDQGIIIPKLNMDLKELESLLDIKSVEERGIVKVEDLDEDKYCYFDLDNEELFYNRKKFEYLKEHKEEAPEYAHYMDMRKILSYYVSDLNQASLLEREGTLGKIEKYLERKAKELSLEYPNDLIFAYEKEQNSFYKPSRSSNGGGYHQPYIKAYYNGNSLTISDNSCGDFGTEISIILRDEKDEIIKYSCEYNKGRRDRDSNFYETDRELINLIQEDFGYTVIVNKGKKNKERPTETIDNPSEESDSKNSEIKLSWGWYKTKKTKEKII